MSTQHTPNYSGYEPAYEQEVKARVGAGTAIKIGFFGAFGVFLFSLVVSIILGIVGLLAGAALIPFFRDLLGI